jgi:hypothetical protein
MALLEVDLAAEVLQNGLLSLHLMDKTLMLVIQSV